MMSINSRVWDLTKLLRDVRNCARKSDGNGLMNACCLVAERRARLLSNEGVELYNNGFFDEALAKFNEGLEKVGNIVCEVRGVLYNNKGVVYKTQGLYVEAFREFIKAGSILGAKDEDFIINPEFRTRAGYDFDKKVIQNINSIPEESIINIPEYQETLKELNSK